MRPDGAYVLVLVEKGPGSLTRGHTVAEAAGRLYNAVDVAVDGFLPQVPRLKGGLSSSASLLRRSRDSWWGEFFLRFSDHQADVGCAPTLTKVSSPT